MYICIHMYVFSVCVHAWEWIWWRAVLETHLGMLLERAFQSVHGSVYVCLCVSFAFNGACENACLRGLCFSFDFLNLLDALVWSTSPRIMLLFHGQVNLGAHIPAQSWLLGKLVFGLRRAESSERRLGEKGKGLKRQDESTKTRFRRRKRRRIRKKTIEPI